MKAEQRDKIKPCGGTGQHQGWKRGFLLVAGAWRCRVCRAVAHV